VTHAGHRIAGAKALKQAGLTVSDIKSFHPHDDFIFAIVLQLEMIGCCGKGEGAKFIRATDFHFNGDLPLNTGGGQISAGQAGLAGGGTNLVEAVRQLFGDGERSGTLPTRSSPASAGSATEATGAPVRSSFSPDH
jgi:acetyl-CoA acetyltransferase